MLFQRLTVAAATAVCLTLGSPAQAHRPAAAPTTALAQHVHADMDFLADDEMHGRGSMTRDEHLAALYCAAVFEGLGLKPAGDGGTSFVQRISVDLSTMSDRAKQRMAIYEDVPRTETWNAVAVLPGSDPILKGEVILLTAHLDHLGMLKTPVNGDAIFNGADDDASGTTAVLKPGAGRWRAGRAPRRTVVFALFGSEEAGGYGARGFLAHPPVPLTSLVANLEFEMIGRPDPAVPEGTLWLTGYERSHPGTGAGQARRGPGFRIRIRRKTSFSAPTISRWQGRASLRKRYPALACTPTITTSQTS